MPVLPLVTLLLLCVAAALAASATPAPAPTPVSLPDRLEVVHPTRFSHWRAGTRVQIQWLIAIRDPNWAPPAPRDVSDETARRQRRIAISRPDGTVDPELERQQIERENAAAAPQLVSICDWTKGVTLTYRDANGLDAEPTVIDAAAYVSTPNERKVTTAEYEWTIPTFLPSGVYVVRVACNDPMRTAVYGDSVRVEVRNSYDETIPAEDATHWSYVFVGVLAFFAVFGVMIGAMELCRDPNTKALTAAERRRRYLNPAADQHDS